MKKRTPNRERLLVTQGQNYRRQYQRSCCGYRSASWSKSLPQSPPVSWLILHPAHARGGRSSWRPAGPSVSSPRVLRQRMTAERAPPGQGKWSKVSTMHACKKDKQERHACLLTLSKEACCASDQDALVLEVPRDPACFLHCSNHLSSICVCSCVCVWERETQRERESDPREKKAGREKDTLECC